MRGCTALQSKNHASLGYHFSMRSSSPAEAPAAPTLRERDQIPDQFKWDLRKIFPDWAGWQAAYAELDRKVDEFGRLEGTLAGGGDKLLAALTLRDDIGQLIGSFRPAFDQTPRVRPVRSVFFFTSRSFRTGSVTHPSRGGEADIDQ